MSIIYTLSTLREYTWNGFIGPEKKPFSLSYLAVSKEQAYNGLLSLVYQIGRLKKQVNLLPDDSDKSEKISQLEDRLEEVILANIYGSGDIFEFTMITQIVSSDHQSMTLAELITTTEPTINKLYPASIHT